MQGRLIACAESIVKCVIERLPMYRAAELIQIGQQDKQARISKNYKSLESAKNTAGRLRQVEYGIAKKRWLTARHWCSCGDHIITFWRPPTHPAYICIDIFISYPLYHLLCIGHLATFASNSLNLTFPHSVPLKKSAMTRLPLTCIKSIILSIPNPTPHIPETSLVLAPVCDLSYLSQWLLPLSPSTASMTVTLVLNPIFQVSHLSFVS